MRSDEVSDYLVGLDLGGSEFLYLGVTFSTSSLYLKYYTTLVVRVLSDIEER